MATGKGSRHEWLRAWSLAVVAICACRIDNAGLAPATGRGGAGGAGGVIATGAGGTVGAAGSAGGAMAGTTGQAGGAGAASGGSAGTGPVPLGGADGEGGDAGGIGVAGMGAAGTGGAGIAGAAGTGAAGTVGTGAAGSGGGGSAGGGAAGVGQGGAGVGGGAAGTGVAGAAGTGVLGTGGGGAGGQGLGGRGGTIGGCGFCPACTHCMNGTCSPDQGSMWKVICVRATIAQTKPGGDPWDPALGPGTTTAPDPQCAFWLGNASAAETSVLSNTFTPNWNESITPGTRFSAGLLSSQANPWSIRVTDDDPPGGAETICAVSPALDAAAFASGSATFSAGNCTTLEIGLDCVSP